MRERVRAYGRLYREALAEGHGCLCGVLASEMAVLPDSVQTAVRNFFRLQLTVMGERTKAACVSYRVRDSELLQVDDLALRAIYTPGHTDESFSFFLAHQETRHHG